MPRPKAVAKQGSKKGGFVERKRKQVIEGSSTTSFDGLMPEHDGGADDPDEVVRDLAHASFEEYEQDKQDKEVDSVDPKQEAEQEAVLGQASEEEKEPEAHYNLTDPMDLARCLQDADIGLVRLEYLVELSKKRKPFPRRQEAQFEYFTTRSGEEKRALVSHKEIQDWAEGSRDAIICSVSHAWETKEHPDPCRYQLEVINSHASLFAAGFVADIWLFYDYLSLFQFQRATPEQDESFRRAMQNMHVLYAHESTLTFRINSLTPDTVWEGMKANSGEKVPVYHAKPQKVVPLSLNDLEENRTLYIERGWCKAEIEWSSARSVNTKHQQIDWSNSDKSKSDWRGRRDSNDLNATIPMTPEMFKVKMDESVFTHRPDVEKVIYLQKKIFDEKVRACEALVLEGVPDSEMEVLVESLPHYQNLKTMTLVSFRCHEAEAKALGEAIGRSAVQQLRIHTSDEDSANFMVKALADVLTSNKTLTSVKVEDNKIRTAEIKALAGALRLNQTITHIDLTGSQIGRVGIEALADVLATNETLRYVNLRANWIDDDAMQALADALKSNKTIMDIDLAFNNISDGAMQVLAEALKSNETITNIDLSSNNIRNVGMQALADGLRFNRTLASINLEHNQIGNVGMQALAYALKTNKTVEQIKLDHNTISDSGMQALVDALNSNSTITNIHLKGNAQTGFKMKAIQKLLARRQSLKASDSNEDLPAAKSRDPFAAPVRFEALADSLTSNKTVTNINLSYTQIGDLGTQALADALVANKTVTSINLERNEIGDVGMQALADALRFNKTVASINLEHNEIGDAGMQALADTLKTNKTVQNINLERNNISNAGMQALAEALQYHNKTLKTINLKRNNFGDVGIQALVDALKNNGSIEFLRFEMVVQPRSKR